jgi:hypothetical protein
MGLFYRVKCNHPQSLWLMVSLPIKSNAMVVKNRTHSSFFHNCIDSQYPEDYTPISSGHGGQITCNRRSQRLLAVDGTRLLAHG